MSMLRYVCLTAWVCLALACSSGTTLDAPIDENVAQATQAAVAAGEPWTAEAALPLAIWHPGDAPLDAATVALDGERMVLLPPRGWQTQEAYEAYVYVKKGSFWRFEDLVPEDPPDRERIKGLRFYGRSVALSGDMLLLSSMWSSAPRVYRSSTSVLDSTLKQWDPGNPVDPPCAQPPRGPYELGLSADTALISCMGDGVYVYNRTHAGLAQPQKLAPPDGHADFGRAVAIDKNTIAITSSGAVHLYARYRGEWHHHQTESGAAEHFGAALSLSGDTLVVAGSASGSGPAATVYTRMGSSWVVQQELPVPAGTPIGPEPSVSVSGDTLFFSPDGATAFVYARLGSRWGAARPLRVDDATPKRKVAVSGGHAVVTGPSYASFFDASGSTWRPREAVDIGSRHTIQYFGKLAISGTRAAVVGKEGRHVEVFALSESRWRSEQVLPLARTGYDVHVWFEGKHLLVVPRRKAPDMPYAAPRVYARDVDSWSAAEELVADDDDAILDGGGAVLGDRVVVGDYRNQAAYVFRREGSRWRQEKKLPIPVRAPQEKFAWAIAMDAERVIIGSPTTRFWLDQAAGVPGSAYVFARRNWAYEGQLIPRQPTNETFGNGVALHGDMAVVTAPDKLLQGGSHAHTFVRKDPAGWQPMRPLYPDPALGGNVYFGTSVALLKDTLAIGSLAFPPSRTYVYGRAGDEWNEQQQIEDGEDKSLGAFVAATEGRLLIGAMMEPPRVYRRGRRMQRGDPCSSASDCATGHCWGGVCCNEACQGACRACANSLTNEPDGTCATVMAGTRCSKDMLKCSSNSQTEYALASTCDAAGTCQRRAVTCQDGLKCTEPGHCPWKCNAFGEARHDWCPDQTWCDGESGRCEPQKRRPESCSANEECLSGRCSGSMCLGTKGDECQTSAQCGSQYKCADGVCCDDACTGVCESCNQPGSEGDCVLIPKNQQPSGNKRCPGEGVCKPACDGEHGEACRPSTARCREAACDDKRRGYVIPAADCENDSCPAVEEATIQSCDGYVCDAQRNACKRHCTRHEDCLRGLKCHHEQCVEPISRCKTKHVVETPGSADRTCPGRCDEGQCDNFCSPSERCSEGHECVNQHCAPIQDAGVTPSPAPDGSGHDFGDGGNGDPDGGQPDSGVGVGSGGDRDDDSGSCACRAAGSSTAGSGRELGLLALTIALGVHARRRRKIRA